MKPDEIKKDKAKPEIQEQEKPNDTVEDEYKQDLEDYLEEQGVYIRQ